MSNIKLTYQYTLDSIKVINETIDKTNTKLALVLTLSGVLISFGKDLPGNFVIIKSLTENLVISCPACLYLKLGAYFLIVVAIVLGLWGLRPRNRGRSILPEQLLSDEWNLVDEESYMSSLIIYLQNETLLVLSEIQYQKEVRLEWGIRVLGMAALLLVLDEVFSIYLSKPV